MLLVCQVIVNEAKVLIKVQVVALSDVKWDADAQILSTLVDESDDIPQDLLDLLLSGLVPPKNSDNPVLFE